MSEIIEWAGLCALAFAAACVLWAFGWLTLSILGMRPVKALIYGLPVGAGVFGLLSLCWGFAGYNWGWVPVIGLLLVLGAGYVARTFYHNRHKDLSTAFSLSAEFSKFNYQKGTLIALVLGSGLFAGCQLVIFVQGMPSPASMPIWGDAQFHLSALQLIYETRNVNPVEALIPLYGWEKDTSSYYPCGWHALAVLFMTSSDPIFVTNAMSLMIGAILWPVSLGSLGVATLPRYSRWMAAITPLAAVAIVEYPAVMGYGFSVYPFVMAVALLPAGLGMLLEWQRYHRQGSPRFTRRPWVVGLWLAMIGLVCLQPSVAVSLLLAILVVLLIQMFTALPKWWRTGGRVRVRSVWLPTLGFASIAAVAWILPKVSYIQKLDEFERSALGYGQMVEQFLDGTFAITLSWPWWTIFLIAALLGTLLLLRQRVGWSVLGVLIVWAGLYVASCGEDGYWRMLTGAWYKDYLRLCIPLFALIALAVAALSAHLLAWIEKWLRSNQKNLPGSNTLVALEVIPERRWKPFGAALAVCLLIVGLLLQAFRASRQVSVDYVAMNYVSSATGTDQLDEDEIQLLSQLDEYLEPGAKVFGDPKTGVGFASILSSHSSYIGLPTITQNMSLDQWRLVQYFSEWETNEFVCEIVQDNNIRGLIVSKDIPEEKQNDYGTVLETDLSNGFQLLAEVGGVQLWEITGCWDN